MIGTVVFHKKFRHSVFLAPLYMHAKKIEEIGTEFSEKFSQLSHFKIPFIGARNFCEGDDRDGGFSQKIFATKSF